ncbi:MAG: hypothetical protein Q4G52_06285 [Clostridia bacterium]|nr:hypothetical protein [Clostridia bacterium]
MKHIRSKLAVTLCLALSACGASSALAASDEVPSFTLTAPESGVTSGREGTLTVEAQTPGFLTVELLDASGAEVATLFTFKEIHTDVNDVSFSAEDEAGDPLPAGNYTLSATMESQFGVASGVVTASLTVAQAQVFEEEEEETGEETPETEEEAQAPAAEQEQAPAVEQAQPAQTQSSAASIGYSSGSYIVGDEGLQIGVGVTDTAEQADAGYWGLTADASDAEIWAAITRELVGVDAGENESAYIYDSVEADRSRLGTVSGISQGLNLIAERDDGWALVEAFRNEDGAFVRGYIRSNKLRRATPNTAYGLVIDKAAQTLTVYKDGARIGSCAVSTGLPTEEYLQRETPAGEFITVTRRGTIEYYGKGYTKYTIRINGGYYICEIPTTKKNGSDFSLLEDSLGEKATRGNVCIAHDASSDGGINAEWIWNMTDENKKVKVLIFDDKARSEVPAGA